MKAAPKVNTDGLFIEDVVVDDAFIGIVPFYAETPAARMYPSSGSEDAGLVEVTQPEIGGYIIGLPVPSGLYHPRFDFVAWDTYHDALEAEEDAHRIAYSEWEENKRGNPPKYSLPVMPKFWVEGLTTEEIDELTRPTPQELAELDRIGAELVIRELEALELKQENEVIGQQIVQRELETADLKTQNEGLSRQMGELELRVLILESKTGRGGNNV